MATQLKNIVQFTGLVVGVPSSVPHNLNVNGVAVRPDYVIANVMGYAITYDTVNVTVTRTDSIQPAAVDVWAEYSHTFERVFGPFGPSQPAELPVNPFVAGGVVVPAGMFDPARTVFVAQSGGDETSISSAIAAASALVPPPSATNPATVIVYPGTYTEPPMTVPANVTVVGAGGIDATLVVASTPTGPLFTLSAGSLIKNVRLSGANGVGGVGVLANAVGDVELERVDIRDCTTAIRATGAGVQLTAWEVSVDRAVGEVLTTAFEAVSGAEIEAVDVHVEGSAGALIGTAFSSDGAGSDFHIHGLSVDYATLGLGVSNGGTLSAFAGHISNTTTGIQVAASSGSMHCYGIESNATTDLSILSATAVFIGAGNMIRQDRMTLTAGATIISDAMSDQPGDEAEVILGELQVGIPEHPSESVFGEGDSHVRGMSVFRNTNLEVGTWSDITAEMASSSGSTALAFSALTVGASLYVGGSIKEFPGLKIITTAAIALGTGVLVWEFSNGAGWTTFFVMTADAGTPHAQHAQDVFGRVATEQVRFGAMTGWATQAVNGTTKYWIRARVITNPITTSPTLEQIKLHTNRTEINEDGFIEMYGTGRRVRSIAWNRHFFDSFTGGAAPGNNNLALTTNITVNAQSNALVNNSLDGLGGIFKIPVGLDTSFPIELRVLWVPRTETGDVEFESRFGQINIGDFLDGTIADTLVTQIESVIAGDTDRVKTVSLYYNTTNLVPGDFVGFSLYRDAQAGNLDDTLAGTVAIVAVELFGTFWQ